MTSKLPRFAAASVSTTGGDARAYSSCAATPSASAGGVLPGPDRRNASWATKVGRRSSSKVQEPVHPPRCEDACAVLLAHAVIALPFTAHGGSELNANSGTRHFAADGGFGECAKKKAANATNRTAREILMTDAFR